MYARFRPSSKLSPQSRATGKESSPENSFGLANGPTTLESQVEMTTSSSMAERTIHDYSILSSNNVLTGPEVNVGDNFKLKSGVINMV